MVLSRDHGGGVDAAAARWGGPREAWIDLSTGINPVPYPLPRLPESCWAALPDQGAQTALTEAARGFWNVPDDAAILAAPGASSLIAKIPALVAPGCVHIPGPTYNEHAAAFSAHGWTVESAQAAQDPQQARVIVHPNNPTGGWYSSDDLGAPLTVIDESFADVAPDRSLVGYADEPGVLVLKSFGKFWGLAGLRLGFAIGPEPLVASLCEALGPWPVSGPALAIGAAALNDWQWSADTRTRLNEDAARLDALMARAGAQVAGGTSLFRLYRVADAGAWQARLAEARIWSRVFPYAPDWLRLGLPAPHQWARVEAAL
ncbi:MAG: threonine-phosphate decarboxylase CobD [Roseovarius sp.]